MTEVIEKTENKNGYKKTELGWIPEDWDIKYLGDLCKKNISNGIFNNPNKVGKGYKLINVIDLYSGPNIKTEDLNLLDATETEVMNFSAQKGDIFFTRSSLKLEGIAHCNIFESDEENILFECHIMKVHPKKNEIIPKYLNNYCKINISRKYFMQKAKTTTMTTIDQQTLSKLLVVFPSSRKEQGKIAEILSAWDDGIETLEKLIEQKEILKKATMQKLFLEKESWKMMRFDKIFKDFCKKNCPRERLLSATQENGVIPRAMLSGKVMSPEGSLNGYKLIEAGDFVISLRSFQGGLEYSKYRGILSPAYTVLKNIIDIDKDFYRHFFKSYKFIEKYLSISVIGIRDGKQISYSDLSSVKIPYPPLEEQEKIGKILNCYDEEFQLLNSKLEKLKEQKKGLMQKLLTGQIRVKV